MVIFFSRGNLVDGAGKGKFPAQIFMAFLMNDSPLQTAMFLAGHLAFRIQTPVFCLRFSLSEPKKSTGTLPADD